ncbi:MAG: MFS transporter [Rhodospirillales bacterium]|nr:MFS transporter [Rhodospirillales bacterium]
MEPISVRVQGAVYASGLFGATMSNLGSVVVPLWLLHLHASPLMIGLALGSFNLLPFLFSVHGGAMMDRLGARRVMIGFAIIGAMMPLLYPVFPWIGAVFVFQLVLGLSSTIGWAGAQTLVGQIMRGSPQYAGRLTFYGVLGNLVGPPLVGAGWDFIGPWGAFGMLFVWAMCQLGAALALPRTEAETKNDAPKFGFADLLPELKSYTAAFGLMAMPVVTFLIMVSMLRIGGHSIQSSFYVVYLNGVGLSGTAIGLLLATGAAAAAVGALLAAPMTCRINGLWLLLITSAISVALIAITPWLGLYVLFLFAQAGRGLAVGISTPLIITEMSSVVGSNQGKAVGLRTMSNRFMSTIGPIAMGGLVSLVGLESSLLIGGGVLVALMVLATVYAKYNKIL